jgi:hypothetical protein
MAGAARNEDEAGICRWPGGTDVRAAFETAQLGAAEDELARRLSGIGRAQQRRADQETVDEACKTLDVGPGSNAGFGNEQAIGRQTREPLASRGGDRLLFDNANGGSGRVFDWSLVEQHPELQRAIVAGGISRHNAVGARRLGAFAIDVGSSMDFRPGRKSPVRIAALFGALRSPSRQQLRACA